MAGRDLKALIAAYRDGDDLAFRRAAQAIIEDEESKKHTRLAKELRGLLAHGSGLSAPADPIRNVEPPTDRETELPLMEVLPARRALPSLVLSDELQESLVDIVNEVAHWPELDAAGVPRRRTILLYGPPGCGKTTIAEAMAAELGRSLVLVKAESVVSSYLGETASNIAKIFNFARSGPYVVCFDEFDSLGQARVESSDHGEIRRVVNSVLQMIDRYSGGSLLIATTNYEKILDSALWRRFSEVYEVPLPDYEARLALLSRTLLSRYEAGVDLAEAAEALAGLPHAAVEKTAYDALRIALLDNRRLAVAADLQAALAKTLARPWL